MKTSRREFLLLTTVSPLVLNSLLNAQSVNKKSPETADLIPSEINTDDLAEVPEFLQTQFKNLINWINETGWDRFFYQNFGINLETKNQKLETELFKTINAPSNKQGFGDFGGKRLLEPGDPAMSLLYYALASASVKPFEGRDSALPYPTLEQIDILENYIYSLKKIREIDAENYALAVFSYEFREARKTPHEKHADLVFSRAGIARIGSQSMNYDAPNRCFSNAPLDRKNEKEIAVTPAKYGLFLARKVKYNDLALMSMERKDDNYKRDFLLPVRKIFDGDFLLGGQSFTYVENHRNEKLFKLVTEGPEIEKKIIFQSDRFNCEMPPFKRISCTNSKGNKLDGHNSELVELIETGSTALLSSKPCSLVREAFQKKERVRIKVPEISKSLLDSNRRYGALKLQDRRNRNAVDYILTEGIFKKYRPTRFSAPRNAPLFVNIKNEVSENGVPERYLSADTQNFEEELDKSYWVGLFEDSICDGCVAVEFSEIADPIISKDIPLKQLFANSLPAFSLVTAPDFFQHVDNDDVWKYDSNFLVGGTESLSTARTRPNPAILNPVLKDFAFPENASTSYTVTAVVSALRCAPKECEVTSDKIKTSNQSSFLPDIASFVFAPGWDVTYSGNVEQRNPDIFLATYGLGSPFAEDMKLCAAANGMWAVASPDAARTFYGSLEPVQTGIFSKRRPPTAIPLLDQEIGLHKESVAVEENKLEPSIGWDGEQGPFLIKESDQFIVNFTDIKKADYVKNAIDGNFDMSLLRNLTTHQIISRMECLKKSIKKIESSTVAYSKLWLVSVEEVKNWQAGAKGIGISNNIFGTSKDWAISPRPQINGKGFLFVFVEIDKKPPVYDYKRSDPKRMLQYCKKVHVCQVTENYATFCSLNKKTKSLRWK